MLSLLKKLYLPGLLLTAALWAGCQETNPVRESPSTHSPHTAGSTPKPETIRADGDSLIRCGTPDVHNPDDLSPVDPVSSDIPFHDPTCKEKSPAELGIAIRCTSDEDPACGCDGKTYRNACWAAGVGGVNVRHMGACK